MLTTSQMQDSIEIVNEASTPSPHRLGKFLSKFFRINAWRGIAIVVNKSSDRCLARLISRFPMLIAPAILPSPDSNNNTSHTIFPLFCIRQWKLRASRFHNMIHQECETQRGLSLERQRRIGAKEMSGHVQSFLVEELDEQEQAV